MQRFTGDQRAQVFALWSERGDISKLAALVEKQPELLNLAWRGVAKYRASRGDFRGALELAERFGERPILPEAGSAGSIEQLQKDVYASANNYQAGFALHQQQMQEKKIDDALMTVRRFTSQPTAPAYFHFLESEAWIAKGDQERAWKARLAFEAAKAKPQ